MRRRVVLARVDRVVFGAADPKAGFAGSLGDLVRDPRLNHRAELTSGVLADECGEVLRAFFRERRGAAVVGAGSVLGVTRRPLVHRRVDLLGHVRQLSLHRVEVTLVHHDRA